MPVCTAYIEPGLRVKPAARPPLKPRAGRVASPAGNPPGEAPIGLPRSSVGLMLLVILIEYLTFI